MNTDTSFESQISKIRKRAKDPSYCMQAKLDIEYLIDTIKHARSWLAFFEKELGELRNKSAGTHSHCIGALRQVPQIDDTDSQD